MPKRIVYVVTRNFHGCISRSKPLIAGYASQFFRARFRKIGEFPYAINVTSGLLLVALGVLIFIRGMTGFGF